MQLQIPKDWSKVSIAPQCGFDIPERMRASPEWDKVDALPGLAQILRCSRQARWITDSTVTIATEQCDLEKEFNRLTTQWRRETRHVSSIHERSMNRAYQKVIRMGKDAVPFILRDLERTRDHWLWALDIIEDNNPAEHMDTFEDAVDAWLRWGKAQKHLK